MTSVLGISAYYHDSAAALIVDGEIVAAAQEERFTRKKFDETFPVHAVAYCLREAGLRPSDLDYVGFYEKPMMKFDRLVETFLSFSPRGYSSFAKAVPVWLHTKLQIPRALDRALGGAYTKRFVFPEHHESHAASAFYPSPFDEAAILTLDGVGEWATTTCGSGQGNRITLSHEIRFPHSLGLLYSAFTYYCGFRVNSGEYKLMGLAPYGEPRFEKAIRRELIDIKEDGSFRLNLQYFDFPHGLRMTSRKFHELFGGPPRQPEAAITEREMDIAALIQAVTEDIMLKCARYVHRTTRMKNLCLAGGVALNCVGNGRILREGPFHDIWVQPAAGDAGGALGVASLIWHQLLGMPRRPALPDSQKGSLLGPEFDDESVRKFLDGIGARYRFFEDDAALCGCVAELIGAEQVVGWVQGRMEFGPRALGARSILGDARRSGMQSQMNLKIKFRESFRPFAPSVLRERVQDYFETPTALDSAYMLMVASVREDKRLGSVDGTVRGLEKLKQARSVIPAVTHVDFSARIQTVDRRHGRFYDLLKNVEALSGCPVVINTSFNVRGEPIVCTPQDAYRCFMATNIDALAVGHFVMLRTEQPQLSADEVRRYISQFELD